MSRYFVRASKANDDEYWPDAAPLITSLEVSDHQAIDTGLLSSSGEIIMRAPNPMGFGKDDEW